MDTVCQGKDYQQQLESQGNKHDHYTVAVLVDETGMLNVGSNDMFLLRDV